MPGNPGHRHRSDPGICKRKGILDPHLVADRVGIHAGEAFDYATAFARSEGERVPILHLAVEIRGLDHQCVSLPTATWLAHPLADRVGQAGPAVDPADA